MVREDLKLSDVLTLEAFENAITVNAAIGGSTNFVIHLLAIAARIGVDLTIDDFNNIKNVPLLANLQPSGKYFMEDFYYAGGLPALMKELHTVLHSETITVSGKPIEANYSDSECFNRELIGTLDAPFNPVAGIAVVKGNLCENGAVLKPSAASPALLKHTGKAVVFENIEDFKAKIEDPDLDGGRKQCAGFKKRRAKRLPRHAGSGQYVHPKKAAAKRDYRYGTHFGRSDERYWLRHRGVTYFARSSGWRHTGDRKKWRHHSAGCSRGNTGSAAIGRRDQRKKKTTAPG